MRVDLYTGPKTIQRMRTMVNVSNIRRDIRNVCNFWWSWGFQLMDYCENRFSWWRNFKSSLIYRVVLVDLFIYYNSMIMLEF